MKITNLIREEQAHFRKLASGDGEYLNVNLDGQFLAVLMDFPQLRMTLPDGREESVMKRTTLVANNSSMPVAAREASIYTGVCCKEESVLMDFPQLRMTLPDGHEESVMKRTTLVANTSNMPVAIEKLLSTQVSPWLSTSVTWVIITFDILLERAEKVKCLGSPDRAGSVTIVGAVSPPGGDFSDPVTAATLGIVQVFWGLDKKLAQREHFPYSKYTNVLSSFYEGFDADFISICTKAREILQREDVLNEIVQVPEI
ncbi:hypothetical protein R1flu_025834 [Riccia fluitans]|uniref:ATPase F1/V1/A1 complex alpha/beta subunit nucleotide-binding domain-containing protein n=1 Tax=Riccia fluitans TaxID=41844 RepID=A0ABD1XZ29_9MARC